MSESNEAEGGAHPGSGRPSGRVRKGSSNKAYARAYHRAQAALRDAHRAEFESLLRGYYIETLLEESESESEH